VKRHAASVGLIVLACIVAAPAIAGEGGGVLSRRWSPYLVGACIGVLSMITFLTVGHPIGVSTSFVTLVGIIAKHLRPSSVEGNEYFRKHPPEMNWQLMFVVGIPVGALLSAFLSGDLEWCMVPPLWFWQFGDGLALRWLAAFAGGFLMMFGARWANGCTSGHGISGCTQLAPSGWIAVICFSATGIAVANFIYRLG